jgi:LysM repeat protein
LQPLIGNGDNKKSTVHRVAPKEGLYAIAKAYHVTVQQLKEWNNLDSDNLKIGQEIIVSK